MLKAFEVETSIQSRTINEIKKFRKVTFAEDLNVCPVERLFSKCFHFPHQPFLVQSEHALQTTLVVGVSYFVQAKTILSIKRAMMTNDLFVSTLSIRDRFRPKL